MNFPVIKNCFRVALYALHLKKCSFSQPVITDFTITFDPNSQ
jgi:hypothetical protein